jgi:hypothetical protein
MSILKIRSHYDLSSHDFQVRYSNPGCVHNKCPSCRGSGLRADGKVCIHVFKCECPSCSKAN